ncbi:MAG: protein BatD [Parachlamydiaceae bacterium]|nr:protein BatD [Parachlamydiaceae bacterium]
MSTRLYIFILGALCSFSLLDADVTLTLDRATIGVDEAFTADFSSREPIKGEPDFSPLQRDFKIISSSQNFMTGYSKGKFTNETHYKLVLRPKLTGRISIPSIAFGQDLSQSKFIEVTNATASKPDNTLFLEIELSPKEAVYPLTQLIYTIRLYRSVNLAEATLSEVSLSDPDAIVELLEKDKQYEYIHPNGMRFIALERKYAVFPQHSGELRFSPIVFEGQVIKGGSAFFNLQTEFKRISSDSEKVTVMDIPAPFNKSNWFAAQDLKLIEEWSADPNKINVGEPITWTLTLAAEGCLGNQIPEIALNLPINVKHYNDKPEITNNTTAKGFTGVRKIKTALIATKPGELILPEISLKWWDLKTNQMRVATLPSRAIQVKEELVAMADQANQVTQSHLANPQFANSLKSNENLDKVGSDNLLERFSTILPTWVWGSIGLNLIWVFILLRTICKRAFGKRADTDVNVDNDTRTFSNRNLKSLIKQACYNKDAKQAETYILAWAKIQFPDYEIFNLAQIKNFVTSPLQEAINDLNTALYGQRQSWDGTHLWKAIAKYSKHKANYEKGSEETGKWD